MMELRTVIVTSLACLVLVAEPSLGARDWWMDEPYGNDSYNSLQLYGQNLTLTCDDGLMPAYSQVMFWIRPDMTVMPPGYSERFWTLDGDAGWDVTPGGEELILHVLQESQFGFYHCIVRDSENNYYASKKAVNYKGAYFGDLWPKYRMPTIIGCSAAGGFLVIAIVLMLVCTNYCPGPEDDDLDDDQHEGSIKQDLDDKALEIKIHQEATNQAFQGDCDLGAGTSSSGSSSADGITRRRTTSSSISSRGSQNLTGDQSTEL